MFTIIGTHGSFQVRKMIVYIFIDWHINFCRSSPKYYYSTALGTNFKRLDIFTQS